MVKFLKRRLLQNTTYSLQGLLATWQEEEAFRIEVILAVILIPVALFLGETRIEKLLLIGSILLVLIVELLNSGIESIVDRISNEQHILAGRAKDQGSAAVMLSLMLTLLVWGMVLWP